MSERLGPIGVQIEDHFTMPDEETNRQKAAETLAMQVDIWRSYQEAPDHQAEVGKVYKTDDGQIELISHATGSITMVHTTETVRNQYLFDSSQKAIERTETLAGQAPRIIRTEQAAGYQPLLALILMANRAEGDRLPIDKNL